MLALGYDEYGTAPTIRKMAPPSPKEGEVLIEVARAALNPLDLKLQSGKWQKFFDLQLPYVMGSDFSGIVKAVGADVDEFRPGDRVIARSAPLLGGAFAQYALVERDHCVKLPESLSMAEGAAIPTAAGTAWHSLFDIAGLQPGQHILIHAGAGGVGSFAVQFAKRAGAHVIATASGDGIDLVRSLGADEAIDYKTHDFTQIVKDVNVVLDTIGFETQERSFDVLKKGGHLASIVNEPDARKASALGVKATRVYYKLEGDGLRRLVEYIAREKIRILIDSEFAFSDHEAALDRQRSARARGKIILDVESTHNRD